MTIVSYPHLINSFNLRPLNDIFSWYLNNCLIRKYFTSIYNYLINIIKCNYFALCMIFVYYIFRANMLNYLIETFLFIFNNSILLPIALQAQIRIPTRIILVLSDSLKLKWRYRAITSANLMGTYH